MRKPRKLAEQRVSVDAPPELLFQVVSSAGKVMTAVSDTERVVEFETKVGDRTIVTRELVTLDPPRTVFYKWLSGPLPYVVETIEVLPAPQGSELRYLGEYATSKGPIRCLVGLLWVSRIFNRLVREHLEEAKRIAEARAARSRVFPRQSSEGS